MNRIWHILGNALAWVVLAAFSLLLILLFSSQSPPLASPAGQVTASPLITPLASPTAVPSLFTPPVAPSPTPARYRAEKIQVTGEHPIDPTGNAIFLAWSPTGDKLLFRKSGFDYVYARFPDGTTESGLIGDLWMMNADGANRRLIARTVGSWAWSLDEKYLAYSAPAQAEGIQGNLYIMDTTTFQVKKLTSITFSGFADLYWLPSGDLTFLRNGQIFIIRPDGTGERQLNNIYITPPGLRDSNNVPRFMGLYHVSPNGKRVAYGNPTIQDWPLWLANLDGSNPVKITDHFGGYSAWSPDGATFAFVTLIENEGSGFHTEIWLANADGTNVRRLVAATHEDEQNIHPTWSPDGQVLAFVRRPVSSYDARTGQPPPSLQHQLWIINGDGTQMRLLIDNAGLKPCWSPRGSEIAFTRPLTEKFDLTPTTMNSFLTVLSQK